MTTETATKLQVGDFINVPAWETSGQVIAVEAAHHSSDEAQRVLLQDAPEAAGRWYTLEPGEFEIES